MVSGNETEAGYLPSLVQGKAHKFVVLSGCSGAGKSSLLSELGRRGFPIGHRLEIDADFDFVAVENLKRFLGGLVSRRHDLGRQFALGHVAEPRFASGGHRGHEHLTVVLDQ